MPDPAPRLPATLPYKGRGSARGTELTSCLCALSGVDYNREWEEEPLAPRQPSRRPPGAQDNPSSSRRATLGSGTSRGDISAGGRGSLWVPLTPSSLPSGCKKRSS